MVFIYSHSSLYQMMDLTNFSFPLYVCFGWFLFKFKVFFMIPSLINMLKVSLNITGDNQHPAEVTKPQQPKKQQKNEDSPPSPTFKNVNDPQNNTQPQQENKTTNNQLPGIQTVGKHGQSQHQYLKQAAKHVPSTEIRKIKKSQLEKHKTRQSAWLSLDGVVYDVTVYMDYHPGGDILLQGCGKECRKLFNQYHSWVNGKNLLGKYKIGILV